MFRGAADLLARDLPLAFADVADRTLQDGSDVRGQRCAPGHRRVHRGARVEGAPERDRCVRDRHGERRGALSRRGADRHRPRRRCWRLASASCRRRRPISKRPPARVEPRRPGRSALEVWRDVLDDHPKRGELPAAAQKTVDELLAFIRERRLVDLPEGERVVVAAAPAFDLGLASMHSSPPLEPHPVKSYYYVTDAQADWPAERQNAWLQKFNYPTLADISAHEVAPGHYVHSLFMRRTPGKIRRIWIGLNPFPQPSSGQDGWAHYAEQLVTRRRLQAGGSALPAGADQRSADAHLPADRRSAPAQRRLDDRSRGGVLRARGAPAGAGGASGSGPRHLRSDLRRLLSRQDGRVQAAARLCGRREAARSTCASSTSGS